MFFQNEQFQEFVASRVEEFSATMEEAIAYTTDLFMFREQQAKEELVNLRVASTSSQVLYGERRLTGVDVFYHQDDANNKLYIVQRLCEGEIDSAQNLYLDNVAHTYYGSLVDYTFYSGSASQVTDVPLSAICGWDDRLKYSAYIIWELTYDENYFSGIPDRVVQARGNKVFDFRTGTTAYSNNPVLCLYDYYTSTRYGLSKSSSLIDIASWTTAADYCDTKGFTVNALLKGKNKQNINIILETFRGLVHKFDGKYFLKFFDLNEEVSVMTLTDDDILNKTKGRNTLKVNQPSAAKNPDGMIITYNDEDQGYVENFVVIGDVSSSPKKVIFKGITNRDQAGIIGNYKLERMKLNRTLSGSFIDRCQKLAPSDIVDVNFDDMGIEETMRVISTTTGRDNVVSLTLGYETTDLYDESYNSQIEDEYSCTFPDRNAFPPIVTAESISESTEYYRLRTESRFEIDFTLPSDYPWFKHVEVWVVEKDSTPDISEYKHQFNTTTSFRTDYVEQGHTYWYRLRTVNHWGVKDTLSNAIGVNKMVTGVSSAPASLAALFLIANNNTVNLYSDVLSEADIEVYEFRFGNSWSSAVFLGANRSPDYSLSGVKPGTFQFYVNSKSANGQYGEVPRSAYTTIEIPKGYDLYDDTSYTSDYSSGTFDNAEQILYNGNNYLKCSHTAGVLSGSFLSPVFDLGSLNIDTYLAWISNSLLVYGAGTTWDDIFPSTWDDANASTNTWSQLIDMPDAPVMNIRLHYLRDASSTWQYVDKMELLSLVQSSYKYQVEIFITDPSSEINLYVSSFVLNIYT